jgi:glyoxylase-like metal-dependent hydrolase (beta-lactamase superfamily II)
VSTIKRARRTAEERRAIRLWRGSGGPRNTAPVKRVGSLAGGAALAAAGVVVGPRLWRRIRDWGARPEEDRAKHTSRGTSGAAATEIAPEVYLLGPWGRAQTNAYLVRDGSASMLIDAGWENDGPRIQATARSLLGPGLDPSAILLTHAHPDHDGSARELARTWGCPIFAHPAEVPLATGDFGAMTRYAGPLDRWLILPLIRALGRRRREAILARSSLAGIVQSLQPGGAIPGMEGWRWIHTAGHTPGHVSYVRARDRVVISGDALVTLRVNAWSGLVRQEQGLSGPPWYTTWDRETAAASIREIAHLEPSVLGGGHGLPLAGPGTAAAVQAFAARTMSHR